MHVLTKYFKPKFLVLTLCIVLIFCTLTSCKKKVEPYKKTGLAMGTVITQNLYGDNSESMSKEIVGKIDKLENSYLSWRKKGSDVYKINQNPDKFVSVDDFTYDCINTSIDVSNKCSGIFDITVGNLSSLWNIGSENAKVPTEDEIKKAIETINYTGVSLGNGKIKCDKGQMLDLGAVGKGAACDKIDEMLSDKDFGSAVISVGGSILLHGDNPNDSKWSVAIRNPRGKANEYCAILKLDPCCVSTSGDYERVLTQDGKTYHHILDPKTGYPAKTDIISATVVCDSGVLSDALSTVCFMSGFESSLSILKKYDAEAVLIDKDFNVYVTEGLKDSISITNDGFKLMKG